MKRIERYVFRQTFGALALVLVALTAVVWIAVALKQLNLVTTQGQSTWVLMQMTLLALPGLMGLIAPFALLVAVIFVLNRLAGDSELIVLSAAGAPVWRIARPMILLAMLVTVAVGLTAHLVMPWSLRELRARVIEVRTDLITQVIQPGRFSSPEDDITFHIRDRTLDGRLLGLMVHDVRDREQIATYLAERGSIVKQDALAFLVMEKGHILRRTGDQPLQLIAFDRYVVDLASFEQKVEKAVPLKPRERYLHELLAPGPEVLASPREAGAVQAELHDRFAGLLYPLAFVLVVVAVVGQARTTRQSRSSLVAAAFIIAASVRVAGLSAMNAATAKPAAIALMYGLPSVVVVAATAFAWWNMRPRASHRRGGR